MYDKFYFLKLILVLMTALVLCGCKNSLHSCSDNTTAIRIGDIIAIQLHKYPGDIDVSLKNVSDISNKSDGFLTCEAEIEYKLNRRLLIGYDKLSSGLSKIGVDFLDLRKYFNLVRIGASYSMHQALKTRYYVRYDVIKGGGYVDLDPTSNQFEIMFPNLLKIYNDDFFDDTYKLLPLWLLLTKKPSVDILNAIYSEALSVGLIVNIERAPFFGEIRSGESRIIIKDVNGDPVALLEAPRSFLYIDGVRSNVEINAALPLIIFLNKANNEAYKHSLNSRNSISNANLCKIHMIYTIKSL